MVHSRWLVRLLAADAISGVFVDSALRPDAASCPVAPALLPDATMRAAMQDIEHPGAARETASMLQRRAAERGEPDVPMELAKVLPISWLHISKCGTSFLNVLVHLPGVCPTVPKDLDLAASSSDHYSSVKRLTDFSVQYDIPNTCPGLADAIWGHSGLYMRGAESQGRFMTMLRKPEQRMIGAYKDMVWTAQNEPLEVLTQEVRSWGGLPEAKLPTLQDWMASGSGCMTRMLTRLGFPCGGAGGPPTAEEIHLAKARLWADFSFVGLTDDWPLSMCLLGAMFKVPCQKVWFSDLRQVRPDDSMKYDETELNGTKDVYDAEVYAEAVKIFRFRMAKFNVNEASCWETCWGPAGLKGELNRTKSSETVSTSDWMEELEGMPYSPQ